MPHCTGCCNRIPQGNIAAWRKAEGDAVNPGDILAEIETDKATIEWEAQEEGFIAKIIKPAGGLAAAAAASGGCRSSSGDAA